MPKITAHADIFRDLDGLLAACSNNQGLLGGVEPMMADLGGALAEARELKNQQEDLTAHRQATTQLLLLKIDDSQEMARQLRGFIVARLGSRNELLVQFGIVPNRPRIRKFKAKPPVPPENPPELEATEVSATEDQTGAAPESSEKESSSPGLH